MIQPIPAAEPIGQAPERRPPYQQAKKIPKGFGDRLRRALQEKPMVPPWA